MARLPTAQDLGGRPTPSVQGGISRLQLETPRGGQEAEAMVNLGQSMQGVGNAIMVMAERHKQQIDEAMTEETTSAMLEGQLELEYGDDGFSKVLSGDAVKRPLVDEYKKRHTEMVAGLRDKLKNPDQQMAFDKRADVASRQFTARLYEHVATQSRTYQNVVFEGVMATERRMAAANWAQPGQIELSILRTNMEVERKARLNGLNPERPEDFLVINEMKLISETQIHAAVVDSMILQGKDAAASAYYEQIKGKLTQEGVVTMGEKVQASSVDGSAIRSADAAWEIFGPKDLNAPVRLDLAENWLRQNLKEDPKVLHSAISDLRSRATAHNDAQQEVNASNKAKVINAYHDGADLKMLQQMPEYWALPDREVVRQYVTDNGWSEQQRARTQLEYEEGAKAAASFGMFWRLSNPQVLSTMSENQILALEPQMGQARVNDLMEMRRKLDSPDKVRAATIDASLFNEVAASAGLKPYETRKSDEEVEYLGRLKNEVLGAIDQAQAIKKGPLSREEKETVMQSIIDKQVMLDVDWSAFDKRMPAAAIRPEQRENIYVPMKEIDPAWLNGALNYMRSTGAVPANMKDDQIISKMKSRLEHAYAVMLTGAESDEGNAILEGR